MLFSYQLVWILKLLFGYSVALDIHNGECGASCAITGHGGGVSLFLSIHSSPTVTQLLFQKAVCQLEKNNNPVITFESWPNGL